MTPGKGYGGLKFKKLASNKIRFSLNFKTSKVYKEKIFTIDIEDEAIVFKHLLLYGKVSLHNFTFSIFLDWS